MDRGDQVNEQLRLLLRSAYGEETSARIEKGYACDRPVALRFNTLKTTAREGKEALLQAGFSWEDVPWYADAVVLKDVREEAVMRTDLFREGKIYMQSLSSMLPPLYLQAQSGESVLDMTAAPGGKTTEIAALCEGALITACERGRTRYQRLLFNLDRQGAKRVTALCADALTLDEYFSFDKILLDAPCSGSGTVSMKKNARIDRAYVEKCALLQEKLLKKAIKLLKKGGELLYSTCSVLPRENETVIRKALEGGGVRLVPILPFEQIPLLPCLDGAVSVLPDNRYEGFFLAKLQKTV